MVLAAQCGIVGALDSHAALRAGVAEFATLLNQARSRMPADATVVVTLNGDFLWRSEVDRRDKGYVSQACASICWTPRQLKARVDYDAART